MIEIKSILGKEPTLTPFGIDSNISEIFDQENIKQIETCVEWLRTKSVSKSMNRIATSYGIKHIIERELNKYIANGSFIAAVIYLDIPYVKIQDSPNIHVAISNKELYINDPNRG